MNVIAASDIVTERGFIVARSGGKGRVKNGRPHDPCNYYKVLVFFGKRKHGYWCDPKKLVAPKSMEKFIAWPPPEKKVVPMPKGNQYKYHFGENLRVVREARQLSQIGLGKLMSRNGLRAAQSTICYREQRPDCPSGRFINAAAKSLDVPAFVFFIPLSDCNVIESTGEFVTKVRNCICLPAPGKPVGLASLDIAAERKKLDAELKGGPTNGVPRKSRKVRHRAGGKSRPRVRPEVPRTRAFSDWDPASQGI